MNKSLERCQCKTIKVIRSMKRNNGNKWENEKNDMIEVRN